MEEGPEPQEWVEKAAEERHHGHSHAQEEDQSAMRASAITAAVLAVCASLGSLLSGHAANEAMLAQVKATDQWAFFQSKSTKGHLYQVSAEVVEALGVSQRESVTPAVNRFRGESQKYDREKEEIRKEAEQLQAESRKEYRKHHRYAVGVASFQVGIVLSSVSILVRYRALYLLSLAAGALGLTSVLLGLVG
jgi:hypothetical protein